VRRRVAAIAAAIAVAVAVLTAGPASAASWVKYSPSNPDYPAKVDFVAKCFIDHSLQDDPIVFPGQPGVSHLHDFGGNKSTNAFSTEFTLGANPTNCTMTHDRAAYWVPAVFSTKNGVTTRVTSFESRHYYRAGTTNGPGVGYIPYGLRIVAGDGHATVPQPSNVSGWQCRDDTGNTVPKQSTPPVCPAGDFLEGSVVFPNCWDGVNLDSADHKSHMSYAKPTAVCDAAHPVRLPQLTSAERYSIPAGGYGAITLSSGSNMTLHADFFNAWAPATMKFFVDKCIRASIACEDVSDRRIPPGTTLPAPSWPTGP